MRVTISLTDDALGNKDAVLIAAGVVGFALDRYLDGIGIAIGDIDQTAISDLRRIAGIDAVDIDSEVRAI